MRVFRFVAFALLALAILPCVAFAQEVSYIGSFGNGFQNLLGNDTSTKVDYEQEYNDSYEPVLREIETSEVEDDGESMTDIQSVIDSASTVPWKGNNRDFITSIRTFLLYVPATGAGSIIAIAIGIVFFWWGVRKATRIVFDSFRKGSMSV